MYLLTAISIGFIGSLHCMVMCGPILAMVKKGKKDIAKDLLHHGGRFSVYMAFGIVAGALGASINLMGFQQAFSITLGVVLVAMVLAYPILKSKLGFEAWMGRQSVKFSSFIHRAGFSKVSMGYLMGVANGILPCGLVYLAVAGAATTFTPWDGAMYMLAFGMGTLPALVFAGKLSTAFAPALRNKFRKLIPYAMLVMGGLLIVRGLNLGIPYLSPYQPTETEQIAECQP